MYEWVFLNYIQHPVLKLVILPQGIGGGQFQHNAPYNLLWLYQCVPGF